MRALPSAPPVRNAHPAPPTKESILDSRALELRGEGRSFAAIARLLDLRSPQAAHDCFLRALRRHEPARQRRLCAEELARLRDLELKVRDNASLSLFDRERQLDVVRSIRSRLLGT